MYIFFHSTIFIFVLSLEIMETCILCENETNNRTDICDTCYAFLKWKYGDKVNAKIAEFRLLRELQEQEQKSRTIRRKK